MKNNCKLDTCIIANDNYDLLIKSKDGKPINVSNVVLDNNMVSSVTTDTGDIVTIDKIDVYNKLLYIPGIGYLVPETRIVYKDKDYLLKYGWHTNISNQTILSWYLESMEEDVPAKTLYKEMINDINIVHFR